MEIEKRSPDILGIFILYSRDFSFAAPFRWSSKWHVASCLTASRFLVFSFFGVVLARSFFPSFRLWSPKRCKGVHCVDLARAFLIFFSKQSYSNEYLLAKFGFGRDGTYLLSCFDTAENEPCKVCPLSAYRSRRFRTINSRLPTKRTTKDTGSGSQFTSGQRN